MHAVAGAFGYSGKYIAKKLLDEGETVMTLTNSLDRDNPFGAAVRAAAFHFGAPEKLVENLRGVRVLYNTYWVRFNHKTFTHADAVRNTEIMFAAAKDAGVERVVHISITNPSEDSELEYFSGKARLERTLKESGLSYAILRPTVLFGKEDILINNIAWALRRLPVFGVFGAAGGFAAGCLLGWWGWRWGIEARGRGGAGEDGDELGGGEGERFVLAVNDADGTNEFGRIETYDGERAGGGLALDGRFGQDADAGANLDGLLHGLDVVELHHYSHGDAAAVQGGVNLLADDQVRVERDEFLAVEVFQANACLCCQPMSGWTDEDHLLFLPRRDG